MKGRGEKVVVEGKRSGERVGKRREGEMGLE